MYLCVLYSYKRSHLNNKDVIIKIVNNVIVNYS